MLASSAWGVLLVLAACQGRPALTADVVEFRGGPDHLGRFESPVSLAYGGIAWRTATDGPVRSSPAVTSRLVLTGSADGHLYAMDRRTGLVQWKAAADAAVNSSPAVAGNTVYFASLRGTVYAVSLDDGGLRWSMRTGPALPPAWAGASGLDYYISSPVIAGEDVLVGAPDGILYALARDNGAVRWRGRTEGRIHSSPAVRNGLVFVGSFDGSVYAFDLVTGARRWRYDTEGRSLDSEPFGFDRRSIVSSPAVTDSTVFIGSRDGFFYALDAASGTLRWRVDHQASWSIASPAVGEGVVYDASSDARFIHALDARTGEPRWRLAMPGSVWSSAAIAGGLLFVGDGSGAIHAIDRQSGSALWSFRTGGAVQSSPAVAGGLLVVGSGDGAVYALRVGDAEGLTRAVYWDSILASASRRSDHRLIRDGLTARGYASLAAAGLGSWMEDRIRDGNPSVVVLALDQLPPALAAPGGPLRRYLDAGGKVVAPGDPPFIWPTSPSGDREYAGIRRATTTGLLGVEFGAAQFDRYGARPTALGRQWGLEGWWLASWSIQAPPGGSVLALNEAGLAAAWVRGYGGPPGSGFIQLNRSEWTVPDLGMLAAVAEFRPDSSP